MFASMLCLHSTGSGKGSPTHVDSRCVILHALHHRKPAELLSVCPFRWSLSLVSPMSASCWSFLL
jgi:hypothetical protein